MADLNLDGLFTGISGMFNIFSGVIGGVELQASNIGQLFGVGLVLGVVLMLIGGIFGIFNKSLSGFQFGRRL